MLSAQELNVIGTLNFSVETNVLELAKIVRVARTILLMKMPTVITVAGNLTHHVKPRMETLHVKENDCGGVSHVMDLVYKKQNGEKSYYPVMTKKNVIKEVWHAEEHLNAQSK